MPSSTPSRSWDAALRRALPKSSGREGPRRTAPFSSGRARRRRVRRGLQRADPVEQQFFMSPESMKILRILSDVWLPDLKFGPGRCVMTFAKTPWYWETVTRNIALLAEWGEDFTIRHLVMPNHVECCTYPVLDWIAEQVPTAPVNVMAQFHPDNFCDPGSGKYRDKYDEIARRPTRLELDDSWRRARQLGLKFETTTFERRAPFGMTAMFGI